MRAIKIFCCPLTLFYLPFEINVKLTTSSLFERKVLHSQRFLYLDSRRRALFAGSCGGERGRGLNERGGHLRRHRSGGACAAPAVRHVTHQPYTAVHLDVDVAFGSHV